MVGIVGMGQKEAGRQQWGQGEFANNNQYDEFDMVVKHMESINRLCHFLVVGLQASYYPLPPFVQLKNGSINDTS